MKKVLFALVISLTAIALLFWPVHAQNPSFLTAFACGSTTVCSFQSFPAVSQQNGLGNVKGQFFIIGAVALTSGTPSTATVTNLPFTSTISYLCLGTEGTNAANNLIKINQVSGSSMTITGPATVTDTITYMCVGF